MPHGRNERRAQILLHSQFIENSAPFLFHWEFCSIPLSPWATQGAGFSRTRSSVIAHRSTGRNQRRRFRPGQAPGRGLDWTSPYSTERLDLHYCSSHEAHQLHGPFGAQGQWALLFMTFVCESPLGTSLSLIKTALVCWCMPINGGEPNMLDSCNCMMWYPTTQWSNIPDG